MSEPHDGQRRLWLVAGALAIGHVILMLAGLSLGKVAVVGARPAAYVAAYVHGPLSQHLAGACIACASFLVFLLAATLLGRLLRGRTEAAGWWASALTAAGAIYVAISLAVALPGVAAATYDGHHGAALGTVIALSDLHYFATFASIGALGLFTVALAAAARASGALSRWIAFPGYAVGALCLAAVPGAGIGLVDDAMLAWMLWFAAAGVAMLRRARTAAAGVPSPSAVMS
jgi:hypothetical protein